MLYPDLVARTCGFVGVLGALITLGVWDNPEFLITPQPNYAPVELQITSLNNSTNTAITNDVASTQETVGPHAAKANDATAKFQADTANALALDHTPTHALGPAAIEKTAPAPQQPPKIAPRQTQSASPKATTSATTHTAITTTKPTPNNSARTKRNTTKRANTANTDPANTAITTKQTTTNQNTQTKPTPDTSSRAAKSSTKTAITANTAHANTSNTANTAVAQQRLQSQVANLLVQEIKRKLRYPRNAVRRKLEGVVQVEFKVTQGKITGFRLSKSSGHKILDDAASKLATGMVNMSIPVTASSTIVVVPIKYELL